jgi:FKBP-type peptidyl-prolyl cis-trans isomerase FkpA
MKRALVMMAVVAATAAACGSKDNPTAPSVNVPFSTVDLRVGTGADAVSGRTVTVNYTGWLYSTSGADNKGTQFDSSLSPGRAPFSFVLGTGNVIAGWHQGIAGMKVGGIRRLIIPPNLAYGAEGRAPSIPGNATLIFDVELLSIQ